MLQVQSSPKTPSKRKLTSTERALAESEELVRQWGGSTEGGRRTRSSARGATVTPPAPPPKKPRISTPRRSKKAKEEEEQAPVETSTTEPPAVAEQPVSAESKQHYSHHNIAHIINRYLCFSLLSRRQILFNSKI